MVPMGNVGVEYLKPGMVLNSEVRNHSGRLLLNAGTEITERHIYIFRTWGITEVDIQGVSREDIAPEESGHADPAILGEAEDELRGIFRFTDREHPAIKELFRLCTLRKVRTLSRRDAGGTQPA